MLKQVLNTHTHTVPSTVLQQKISSELIKPSIPQLLQNLEDETRSFGAGKEKTMYFWKILGHMNVLKMYKTSVNQYCIQYIYQN